MYINTPYGTFELSNLYLVTSAGELRFSLNYHQIIGIQDVDGSGKFLCALLLNY